MSRRRPDVAVYPIVDRRAITANLRRQIVLSWAIVSSVNLSLSVVCSSFPE